MRAVVSAVLVYPLSPALSSALLTLRPRGLKLYWCVFASHVLTTFLCTPTKAYIPQMWEGIWLHVCVCLLVEIYVGFFITDFVLS